MGTLVELRSRLIFPFSVLSALAFCSLSGSAQSSANTGWVTAWQASPTAGGTYTGAPCPSGTGLNGQTVRNLVYPSAGGEEIRVRISNLGGTTPLRVGAASIAVAGTGAAAVAGTLHSLTFSGQGSTVIAAESEALSDPIAMQIYSLSELALSVYLPAATGAATTHYYATQTNYIGKGNLAAASSATGFTQPISCWMFVSGVEIKSTSHFKGSLIALGDSITDGFQSTTSANDRYPDYLARRFAALSGATLAVSNAGLSGNKLMTTGTAIYGPPAPSRFNRDVLTQPGVQAVILLEGINDIGANGAEATDLIQVDEGLISRAHAAGLKIYGGTLTPFAGSGPGYGPGFGSASGEQQRQALNTWIRTGGAFDGVIDFDEALRDPSQPTRLLPAYDSGDHLHPSDAGYRVMANTVDVEGILAATE